MKPPQRDNEADMAIDSSKESRDIVNKTTRQYFDPKFSFDLFFVHGLFEPSV